MFIQQDKVEAKYGLILYQGGAVPGKEIRIVDMGDWDVEACGDTDRFHEAKKNMMEAVNSQLK
jgi:alanyl-tRNA synthetase